MIAARHLNTEQEKGLIRRPLPCTPPLLHGLVFQVVGPSLLMAVPVGPDSLRER